MKKRRNIFILKAHKIATVKRKKEIEKEYPDAFLTDFQIEQTLEIEAVNRGFTMGTLFIALRDTIKNETGSCSAYRKENGKMGGTIEYLNGVLYTYGYGRYVLYEKGKWASLIKVKKIKAKKPPCCDMKKAKKSKSPAKWKPVIGKWYNCKNLVAGCGGFDGLGICVEHPRDEDEIHGLYKKDTNVILKQVNGKIWRVDGTFSLAGHEAIEASLKKVAIKKGFKEGVKFRSMNAGDIVTAKNGDFTCIYWDDRREITLSIGGKWIFRGSEWAEIID